MRVSCRTIHIKSYVLKVRTIKEVGLELALTIAGAFSVQNVILLL